MRVNILKIILFFLNYFVSNVMRKHYNIKIHNFDYSNIILTWSFL